ncbi:DEAD box helicase [Tribonema minus]|uniref:DEAD box helicase n=1 Tax=Tribonema minus TaxID=303371 RepID=A0A836CIA6_9STRA|nr:DEAD box helicase [Tribonema minus]
MSLFAKKKSKKRPRQPDAGDDVKPAALAAPASATGIREAAIVGDTSGVDTDTTFDSLGLCDWLQRACGAMGFRRPTPVQQHCIPAVLDGKDVLGCAETGSGKTAAFALPILHTLSKDPYGIYAVVLTPTRELAVQIAEQFEALGAPMGLRHAVVIGGMNMMAQGVELAKRPHVIIATPGRLRDHLQGASPPDLSKLKYLVLDEADRLLSMGFQSEIRVVMAAVPSARQTLLFSATMTDNLAQLESLAMTDPVKYDLTKKATVPATLTQQYLFMPAQRCCSEEAEGEEPDNGAKSIMIFVGSCKRCQEVCETLLQLRLDCVCLHSMMSQKRRLAALGKFKSSQSRILVSTDVSSRGLDIPEVDLVVNFDMPRVATDYVHRVGRTARAGRRGRALSLVTQYDVELVHNIEEYTSTKLDLCEEVIEKDVLKLLNPINKATRVARMRLMELGFDEKEQQRKSRSTRKRQADAEDS